MSSFTVPDYNFADLLSFTFLNARQGNLHDLLKYFSSHNKFGEKVFTFFELVPDCTHCIPGYIQHFPGSPPSSSCFLATSIASFSMKGIYHMQPVVVVDEAHLLDREMLEEVRFLLNFKMDSLSPMALILVGQNELMDKLKLKVYGAIRQRIDLQCKLPHLDRAQVGEYIKRHLTYAGANHEIFSDAAVDEALPFCQWGSQAGKQDLYTLHALWRTERPPHH